MNVRNSVSEADSFLAVGILEVFLQL